MMVACILMVSTLWCPVNSENRYNRIESFDDKQITESSLWTVPSLDKTMCALQCLHDHVGCVSFQFSEVNQDCVGFSARFEGTTASATTALGTQLWETKARPDSVCVDDSSCHPLANSHCHEGGCRCDIGYGGQGDICRSLVDCSVFDDTFTVFFGYFTYAQDISHEAGVSMEECKQFCLDNPNCKATDYQISTSECFPAQFTWLEFPDGRSSNNDNYYLERVCQLWQS